MKGRKPNVNIINNSKRVVFLQGIPGKGNPIRIIQDSYQFIFFFTF